MAKMRDQAPDLAATRTRRASAPVSTSTSAPVFHADDKTKRRHKSARKARVQRLTKTRRRGSLKKIRARTAPRKARETTRRRTVAKASRKQLAALRKARAAKRRYARAPRRAREAGEAKRGRARKVTVRRGTRGRFLKRKVRGYTHEARRRGARRRRRYAREMTAAAPRRRRRRRSGHRRHYVKGHYSHEARRRHGRRRRRYAREFAAQARGRRGRRHSRRYRGALENPLTGMELAITIFTGSVGFMAAEIADRMMAVRNGAPLVTLAVNGGKAPQLPMYDDWPRLLVAAGITGAPLVASAFIKSPTWRSALQTMGIGAGLRSVGNILVGLAAKFTAPAADAKQTPAQVQKNIFAFEQSLAAGYDAWNKQTPQQKTDAEKAFETAQGAAGLPQGTGACPTCKRTDGLGACCGRGSAQPPQAQPPLPPPPPINPPVSAPPPASMAPPVISRTPGGDNGPPPPPPNGRVPGDTGGGGGSSAPNPRIPGNNLPGGPPAGATVPMSPLPQVPSAFSPLPGGPVAGLPQRGMGTPQRFMAGTGSVAPRPNFNWGHNGRAEDAAE
jgi:hypothetical protein